MALSLALACGGSVFTSAPAGDDASTGDGPGFDGAPADGAVTDGAADGAVTDGATSDGPTDGGTTDSGTTDVFEEPPAHCGGAFQCIPAVPSAWTGPADLYLGGAPPPACAGLFTDSFDGMDGVQAPAASCDCSCGPTQVTCGPASLTTSMISGCASHCATTTAALGVCFAAPTGCLSFGANGVFQTVTVPATGGVCSPLATVAIPAVVWKSYARTCTSPAGPAQADCPAGQVCARTPSTPFQPAACIVRAGVHACPAEGYTQAHVEFTGLTDGRGCSACTCGAPDGLQCSPTLYAYNATTNGTCGGMPDSYDPAACVPANNRADLKVESTGSGGPCAASAVMPSGTATPTDATTICCTE